jgi:hypothetical protein
MLQKSARLQYALLALVAVLALTHFYLGAVNNFQNLVHGTVRVRQPFFGGYLGNTLTLALPEAKLLASMPETPSSPSTVILLPGASFYWNRFDKANLARPSPSPSTLTTHHRRRTLHSHHRARIGAQLHGSSLRLGY